MQNFRILVIRKDDVCHYRLVYDNENSYDCPICYNGFIVNRISVPELSSCELVTIYLRGVNPSHNHLVKKYDGALQINAVANMVNKVFSHETV